MFALGGRSFLSLMAEAEVDPKFLNQNHTYFVPVDRSSPAPSDVANDVVIYILNAFISVKH